MSVPDQRRSCNVYVLDKYMLIRLCKIYLMGSGVVKVRSFKDRRKAREFARKKGLDYLYMINDEDMSGRPFWNVYYR